MNVDAISGSAPLAPLDAPEWETAPAAAPGAGAAFGQMVSDGLSQVNGQLAASEVDLQRLATGDVQNLHQVMMRLEESRLSFQLLMQVRNRLLEAYQDVMKMQI
jgi:flagellar hook-basal body complex protein FliE